METVELGGRNGVAFRVQRRPEGSRLGCDVEVEGLQFLRAVNARTQPECLRLEKNGAAIAVPDLMDDLELHGRSNNNDGPALTSLAGRTYV
jgi:hypothetical protein